MFCHQIHRLVRILSRTSLNILWTGSFQGIVSLESQTCVCHNSPSSYGILICRIYCLSRRQSLMVEIHSQLGSTLLKRSSLEKQVQLSGNTSFSSSHRVLCMCCHQIHRLGHSQYPHARTSPHNQEHFFADLCIYQYELVGHRAWNVYSYEHCYLRTIKRYSQTSSMR